MSKGGELLRHHYLLAILRAVGTMPAMAMLVLLILIAICFVVATAPGDAVQLLLGLAWLGMGLCALGAIVYAAWRAI